MITTLLWDIDGIFVDTEKLHFSAWQWLAQKYGKKFSWDEYQSMMGCGGEENMITFCKMKGITEDNATLQIMRRKKYERLRHNGIPVIMENIALAKRFRKEYPELKQATVSSSRRADVDENIAAAGLSGFFVRIISFEDRADLRRKPAPDLYRHACEMLNCSPKECLAFEDSLNGARAAKGAGIKVLMLPTALSPQKILKFYK